jgi:uncharacterized protein YyaL (SSP411 family)
MSVTWQDWSPGVFARAEAEHKPVLLSLITAWSEECAAMDATTYASPEVVSLVAENFVAVRVDADCRPDINERYNLGGWPTNIFLTSRGDRLSGGTHFDAPQMVAALRQVSDAYRDRADEIARRSVRLQAESGSSRTPAVTDRDLHASIVHYRSLLADRFDPQSGGFGLAPKLPHPYAMLFALSFTGEGDSEIDRISSVTLRRLRDLWDSAEGGFCRYADRGDWSGHATEKTLEDNAALLHVYVEAALRLRDADWLEQAAAIVLWVRSVMSDETHGGFFNARTLSAVDKTMYVDRNAMMVGAFIRAAALFDDIWLRDFALKSLEAVIVPAYKPGDGLAHVHGLTSGALRGLLTDQIHAASALIWAHAATGQLPYSMLAAEVLQFAIRTMWDEAAGAFRDRVETADPLVPFELNCHAACVLDRMSVLTGDISYQDRARAILHSRAAEFHEHDLFAAPYALAVREVYDRRPPAGLELTPVDWQLGKVQD